MVYSNAFIYSLLTNETYSIPETVTSLDFFVFLGNQYLTSIIIPSSITHISHTVFGDCKNLESITFDGINQPSCNVDAFNKVHDSIIIYVPNNYNGTTLCGRNVTKQSTETL